VISEVISNFIIRKKIIWPFYQQSGLILLNVACSTNLEASEYSLEDRGKPRKFVSR
jgi:hypothetical protein